MYVVSIYLYPLFQPQDLSISNIPSTVFHSKNTCIPTYSIDIPTISQYCIYQTILRSILNSLLSILKTNAHHLCQCPVLFQVTVGHHVEPWEENPEQKSHRKTCGSPRNICCFSCFSPHRNHWKCRVSGQLPP